MIERSHLDQERNRNMNQPTSPQILEHYDSICPLISEGLRWFLVYETLVMAKEAFQMQDDDKQVPESKKELYHIGLRLYLARLIRAHILMGQNIEVSENFLLEALNYGQTYTPQHPTYELGCYLDYLETWSDNHQDWTKESPQAFDHLDIVVMPETL